MKAFREIQKATKAYALGYREFKVNGVSYKSYVKANRECDRLIQEKAPNIEFYGRHKDRGWEGFYCKFSGPFIEPLTANARK